MKIKTVDFVSDIKFGFDKPNGIYKWIIHFFNSRDDNILTVVMFKEIKVIQNTNIF